MNYKVNVPDYITELFKKTNVLSISIFDNVEYTIDKELILNIPTMVNDKSIASNSDYMRIPSSWLEEIKNDFDFKEQEYWEHKYFLVLMTRNKNQHVVYLKHGNDDKMAFGIVDSILTFDTIPNINKSAKSFINSNFEIKTVITDLNVIHEVMDQIYNYMYVPNVYKDNPLLQTNAEVIKTLEVICRNELLNREDRTKIIDSGFNPVLINQDYKVIWTRLNTYLNNKNTLINPRMEALMKLSDGSGEQSKKDVNLLANEFTRSYERRLKSQEGQYADQKIEYKGVYVHHGLSEKGIAKGTIKSPSTMNFMEIRVDAFKHCPIVRKDFAFNLEGLISSFTYYDDELNRINTPYSKSMRIFNPVVHKFIKIVGAEEFCKIHNIAKQFEFKKIAEATTQRFFNKPLKLLDTHSLLKLGRNCKSQLNAKDFLTSMPKHFNLMIQSIWAYNKDMLNQDAPKISVVLVDDNIAVKYGYEELKLNGKYLCLYNDVPVMYGSNKEAFTEEVSKCVQFITKILKEF